MGKNSQRRRQQRPHGRSTRPAPTTPTALFACECNTPAATVTSVTFIDLADWPPDCPTCHQRHRIIARVLGPTMAGAVYTNETITPQQARAMLDGARTVEGANNPRVVACYAQLMASGQWETATIETGGAANPIVIDDTGHVRYGLQRLEACALANAPFATVVCRWPHTPQG
jgi:hypothetical protein